MEQYTRIHTCECPDEAETRLYGSAIDYCTDDKQGRLWVSNGEYTTQVNFCPFCGRAAKTKIHLRLPFCMEGSGSIIGVNVMQYYQYFAATQTKVTPVNFCEFLLSTGVALINSGPVDRKGYLKFEPGNILGVGCLSLAAMLLITRGNL